MASRTKVILDSLIEKFTRTKDMVQPITVMGNPNPGELTENQKGFIAGVEACIRIIEQTDSTL